MTATEVETTAVEVSEPEPETGDVTESEPEDETDPGEDDTETETGQAAPEPSSFARMEEIGKKLDLLQKHVAKRMGEILGDDVALFEICEICSFSNTPGWRPSGPLPDDVVTAIRHALGQAAPSDYLPDTHSQVCPECAGWGQVASGSKVQGQDLLSCKNCNGMGWKATDEARQPNYNGQAPTTPAGQFEAVAPPPETDPAVAAALELVREAGFTAVPPYRPTTS